MSWVKAALAALSRDETVTVRPSGHSMTGRVNHRDEVVLAPIAGPEIRVGDVVLVRVAGQVYLHLVKAIDEPKGRVLIGNNRGKINGWTSTCKVFGVAIEVSGRPESAYARCKNASACES